MPTQLTSTRIFSTSIVALAACFAFAGCSPRDQASIESKRSEMASDGKTVAANVSNKVSDAMITTSVKAELAKDPNLSALKINVDTADGKVTMSGTAPSGAARDQATTLAKNVKGVVSVDNKLLVEAKS